MRRFAVAVLAPVLVAAAAGCGSSSTSSKSTSSAAATPSSTTSTTVTPAHGNAIAVGETQYKLTPSDPSVKGGTVVISAKNDGTVTHAITVEGAGAGGKDARSADIAPGQTKTLTVTLKPGKKYEWYCPIDGHKGLGMKGEITVTGSGTAASSAAPKTTTTSSSGAMQGGSSTGSSGGSSGGGGYGY